MFFSCGLEEIFYAIPGNEIIFFDPALKDAARGRKIVCKVHSLFILLNYQRRKNPSSS